MTPSESPREGFQPEPTAVLIDTKDPAFDPATVWDKVHAGCPYRMSPDLDGVLLTAYEDVATVAHDDEAFSSDHDVDGTRRGYVRGGVRFPYLGISVGSYPYRMAFIEMDPPEVTPLRRLLNPLFSHGRADERRPRARELVTQHIDRVIGTGAIDFVYDLTSPVPALLTLEAVGVPGERAASYAQVYHDMIALPPDRKTQVLSLYGELMSELHELLARRRREPADDWTSFMLAARIDGDPIPDALIIESMNLMLAGGIDTTTALTSQALRHLNRNRTDRARLMADRSLLSGFCEEMLRYFSPVQMFARTVTTPTTLNGHELQEGDRVILCWAGANRDPSVFDQPDLVQIDRAVNRHQAFGVGIHRCIGAHFARMLFSVMIEEVLERLPDFEIDESKTHDYESKSVWGISTMPATFTPSR
jgi:cytochrome P450